MVSIDYSSETPQPPYATVARHVRQMRDGVAFILDGQMYTFSDAGLYSDEGCKYI